MGQKILRELKPGEVGKVVKILGSGSIHRRILDMGITKDTKIEMERVAPLGDPVEVKIKGYHLSLRKDEAANIFVDPVRDTNSSNGKSKISNGVEVD
ncbi:MAG: ferrous iron transport protein A [Candidatus Edwardsbacteria bacterium]